MNIDICIRRIDDNEKMEALSLVWSVFKEYEAPDYSKEGIEEFYKSIHDKRYLSQLCMYGAFMSHKLVGVIATRSEGTHVALFFVEGKYHRQGIGKQLFKTILKECRADKMTVNSSPYAVPIYHKLGFYDVDSEQVVKGVRFTPMEFEMQGNQTKDMYEKFAYDYDEFGDIENYLGSEKTFFEKIFSENNVQRVLDCACGTGQHLYMLSEMGLQVYGSDYSKSMLEVASGNLEKHGVQVPLRQCDFKYLEEEFQERFDAIVCLTTALPHLHTDEDLLTALVSMKNRLEPNGLLILTQGTTHYTLSLPSIEVVVNREDFSRVFVKEHDDQLQTIHILDIYHSKDRFEDNQYEIVYKIILDDDYRRLLTEAGFGNIRIYGDYDRNPYDKKSKRLIVVAQKISE